jgi:Ca-activated chloride channel family protein
VVGVEVRNGIPPEVIRRIVQANHPQFRACYESGLKRDPSLRGDVKVRFVIDQTGAVETASLDGGTMLDADVRACTRNVFESMSFPESERGKVLVTYPIDYDVE